MMPGLVLQGGWVCVVFSCIAPIILITGFKLHAPPCQVLSTGLFLAIPPSVLLCVVLLNSMLSE